MIGVHDLKAARDALVKARDRAERTSRALYKITELSRLRGHEHGLAKAAYERLRDQYVEQVIAEQPQ